MRNRHVIIFDGVCNLCHGTVNFIIKRDPKGLFAFTPMQSEIAQDLIEKYAAPKIRFDTFLLIKNGACYYRTDAAMEIAKDLSGFWYLFLVFRVLPIGIRDCFYRVFARNRYSLFGRKDVGMVPTADVKSRFLE